MMNGLSRLVLAVSEVPGPAHQVIAALEDARAEGDDFKEAWFKALRSLDPPRSAPASIKEAIRADRDSLAEIQPYLRAAYERRDPTEAEVRLARQRAARHLSDLSEENVNSLAA